MYNEWTLHIAQKLSRFPEMLNIDINKSAKISRLEWFLKDHVILKTGVMVAENSALSSQE